MLQQSDDGALRILTLDRPEQRNALNLPLPKALRAATIDFARRLAAGPTVAIAEAKRLLQSAATRDLRVQLAEEHDAGLRCGRSADAREALAAAVARREPAFKGI